MRKRVGLAAATLALACAAVVLFALPAGAQAPEGGRTITVTGTGSVTAVPDRAEWSFGVQTDAPTGSEALRRNSAAIAKVVAALKAAGVADSDLTTEQVSLYPRTSPDGTEVIGYTATSSVRAVIRDISKAGAIVDAATAAGANQIFGPTLTVSDTETLYRQALDEAFAQAGERAARLAKTAGASLGRVISITESPAGVPVPLAGKAAAGEGGDVAISPGTTEIQGTLVVSYELV
jgi:uncharacterized protein YggE